MARFGSIAATVGSGALAVVGTLVGLLFVALMIGGNTYRTECVLPDGRLLKGWDFPVYLPYLYDAGEGCEETTLTRYLLGEVGVMSETH